MRKTLLAFLAVPLLVAASCVPTREKAFHDGVDQLTRKSGMLTEYRAYVGADQRLQPATKKIRMETADRLEALIEEERKAVEK